MLEVFTKIKDGLLDILLPRFCVGCGREGLYICKDCEVFLSEVDPILGSPTSQISGNQEVGLPNIISVWEYEGVIEKAILKIKYEGQYHIIDELVEKALERIDLKLPDDAVITFVPMYKKRQRERGFNQAELIAQKLGSVHSRRVHRLLEKIRDNKSQVGLGPREREENVKGVFGLAVPGTAKLGSTRYRQTVLLVDDVYTTGATINECIKVLRKNGVKNVWTFTLARKLNI